MQRRLPSYRVALMNSDYILLDGIGMTIYTRIVCREKNLLNLNGTEFLPRVIDMINRTDHSVSIALYGSSSDVIQKTHDILTDKYRHISFYYYLNGYEQLDLSDLEKETTVLIGLGTPRQECFVYENRDFFRKKKITAITVGGLFDFISGNARRGPDMLRKMQLEWAYRMLHSPRRHAPKNMRNLLFFYFLIHDYLTSRNSQKKHR